MKNFPLKRKLISYYEAFYEYYRIFVLRTKFRLKIMSPEKTIKYIITKRCSIARYGDGEFDQIFQIRDLGFQPRNEFLRKRLIDVLANPGSDLLICIPGCMNSIKDCNEHAGGFWIEWGRKNNHHQKIVKMIRQYTGSQYVFGDSQITRPYIDWKTTKRAEKLFPKLKELWKNRDILIVEGSQTRLGVGNDLFDQAKTVKRIIVPAIGAFDCYESINRCIIDNYNGELVLAAIGPTATVLAADLSKKHIQTLDIGNIDIEYEWFLMGAKKRVPIPGKFTNETKDGRVFTECTDEKYLSQIIARVGC